MVVGLFTTGCGRAESWEVLRNNVDNCPVGARVIITHKIGTLDSGTTTSCSYIKAKPKVRDINDNKD